MTLTLAGAAFAASGSIAALTSPQRFAARILFSACALSGLFQCAGAVSVFAHGGETLMLWSLPLLGPLVLGTTPLGALFAAIAGFICVPVALFTLHYAERCALGYPVRAFAALYCALQASIVVLFVCRDVVSFFVVWEIAMVTSAALVAFEWRRTPHARAAYAMLATSEAGTVAALLAMLIALHGSPDLLFETGVTLGGGASWAVVLLSFFGFGVKAGLLPVNSWLPRAYPAAPGNVAALLSGVVLTMGVYGILLINAEIAPIHDLWQGMLVMLVGAASALVGILYATIDDDLKRLLAYSSVENAGIVMIGFGAGFVFLAAGRPPFAAIAFAAGAYHLANHSAYKALLFLGAATVDAETGTRSMNRLGGLIRRLPVTAAMFLIGTLSIAAIPPFNGFASEWLTFQAILRSVELVPLSLRVLFVLCGATLALAAAIGVTCFVKVYGMTFLGHARAPLPNVREPARSARAAMALLAAGCVALGVFPAYVLGVLDRALGGIVGHGSVLAALVPPFFAPGSAPAPLPADFVAAFHALGAQITLGLPGRGLVVMLRGGSANPVVFAMSTTYLAAVLAVLLAAIAAIVHAVTRRRRAVRVPVWAGGLQPLVPEMTYTATGFSNPVRVVFDAVYHPTEIENERETIHQHFRSAIRRSREEVFFADRLLARPLVTGTQALAALLARIHHGRLSLYVGYALAVLVVSLLIVRLL
jgi:hydrogenase-4 component B